MYSGLCGFLRLITRGLVSSSMPVLQSNLKVLIGELRHGMFGSERGWVSHVILVHGRSAASALHLCYCVRDYA